MTDNRDLFQVGVITTTHGLRGEVKVFSTTQTPQRFLELDELLLDTGKELLPVHIRSARFQKDRVILGFKEFTDISEVEPYKKCLLFVTRENAVPLEEDEYYIKDLIGLSVYLEDGSVFGTLKDVLETGANDVYVMDHEGKEVLVPAIRECIREVSVEEGRMVIHLLPGLLD